MTSYKKRKISPLIFTKLGKTHFGYILGTLLAPKPQNRIFSVRFHSFLR